MLKRYERLLLAKERKLKANYKESYRKLEREFKQIFDYVEASSGDYQLTLDDLSRDVLKFKTASAMRDLYLGNEALIRSTFDEIFDLAHDKSIEALGAKESLVGIAKAIDRAAIIDKSIAGVDWTARLRHASENTRYDLINVMAGGIEAGESYGDITKKVAKKFAMDYGQADRLVRTEGHRIYQTTTYETMESVAGQVQMFKTWHCVRDERVRDSHQALDGKQVPFDVDFESQTGAFASRPGEFGVPSEDINCRCYLSYEYKEEPYDPWEPKDVQGFSATMSYAGSDDDVIIV